MREVVFANEKHGPMLYANALSCLLDRYQNYGWYSGEEAALAKQILDREDEAAAWEFLDRRADHEYEYVELSSVIDRFSDE